MVSGGAPGRSSASSREAMRSLHHVLHLIGHTRNGIDDLLADRTDQTRSCPTGLDDDRRAPGHVGLAGIVLRHLTTASAEHRSDPLDDVVVPFKINVHHGGDRLASDVVLGRTETTAANDGVAPRQCHTERINDPLMVVSYFGLKVGVDPGGGELLTNPR